MHLKPCIKQLIGKLKEIIRERQRQRQRQKERQKETETEKERDRDRERERWSLRDALAMFTN